MRKKRQPKTQWKRSLVKAVGYRVLIVIMDFATVYLFTRRVEVAAGFMILSNLYTTVTYYFYERAWARVSWGRT